MADNFYENENQIVKKQKNLTIILNQDTFSNLKPNGFQGSLKGW